MTGSEIAYAVLLLVAVIAGIWQLAKWATYWLERVCDRIEQRIAARCAPSPSTPAVTIEAQPTRPELVVTFWNGCAMTIDRTRESGRLALLSGLLLRFHWHARPSA